MFARHRPGKGHVLGVSAIAAATVLGVIAASPAAHGTTRPQSTAAKTTAAASASGSGSLAVGPGYNAAHVYVPPADVNAFVSSWEATFGGTNTTPHAFQITPVPSTTISTLLFSPVGFLSVYGYETGIPYPWGQERVGGAQIEEPGTTFREVLISSPTFGKTLVLITKNGAMPYPLGLDMTGYQVTNLSTTLAKATASGAHVLAGPYDLPGLETAIVEFPGDYIAEIHEGGI